MTSSSPALGLAFAEETSIVALAQAGDERAFAELVHRRQSFVRNLLRRLSRDASLADDLAQETFLHAWRQLSRLRAHGAFGGWLRQIAITIWLQQIRRQEAFTVIRAELPTTCPSNAGMSVDLDTALAQLAPEARLCIVLSYHEGLSHGEIAAATGLALGTVKSHIVRGAARLKELLKAYDRPSDGS